MTDALNRFVRFSQPDFHPPTGEPCPGQVGIECECPIREGFAIVMVTSDKGECHPGGTERDRVILAQLYRTPSEPHRLGTLLLPVGRPATTLGLSITTRCHGIGRRKVGVQVEGPGERCQCFSISFSGPLMKSC